MQFLAAEYTVDRIQLAGRFIPDEKGDDSRFLQFEGFEQSLGATVGQRANAFFVGFVKILSKGLFLSSLSPNSSFH